MPGVGLKELVESAEAIGNVYSPRGIYEIDRVPITFREGVRLPAGDYVFIPDPRDGLPIIYQVSYPHYFRPSFDFEEGLVSIGRPLKDKRGTRYRCLGILVGKLAQGPDGRISIIPPDYPVPPMADVYKCLPDLVALATEPREEWCIEIGVNPETGRRVKIALRPLVRQSLLLTGAQGTGKTTAMLTLISRAAQADPPLHFLVLDWSGEYISLRDVEGLGEHVAIVPWDRFAYGMMVDEPTLLSMAFQEDPRMTPGAMRRIRMALEECKRARAFPSRNKIVETLEVLKEKETRYKDVAERAIEIVEDAKNILDEAPPEEAIFDGQKLVELVRGYRIVIVDFSKTEDERLPDTFDFKKNIAAFLARAIWEEARKNVRFGCVIVSDEAHRLCPEFETFDQIWHTLATEGGRNGCPFWLVARRLSIVSKKITVESQQNFFCFNVEDVDRRRVEEDLGEAFAGLLGSLAPGEAMVKSMGFRLPGQVVHVQFDVVVEPASARHGPRERFEAMKNAPQGRDED